MPGVQVGLVERCGGDRRRRLAGRRGDFGYVQALDGPTSAARRFC
jgi:hypothetical protein